MTSLPPTARTPGEAEDPFSAFDGASPDQDEVIIRDQMAALSRAWKNYPRKQADALALHYFGDLSLAEIGKILKTGQTEIERLLASQVLVRDELIALAGNVHPDQNFIAGLLEELRKPQKKKGALLSRWLSVNPWQPAFESWRRFSRLLLHAGQAGLLLGVLVLGVVMVQRQSGDPHSSILGTPTSIPLALQQSGSGVSNDPSILVDYPGPLVPPDSSVCQEWQASLAKIVDQNVDLTISAFNSPTQAISNQSKSGAKGTSCSLETMVINWDLRSGWSTFDFVSELFLAKDFNQIGDVGYPSDKNSDYFDPGCYGLGRTFESSDTRGVLTVSWCRPVEPKIGLTPGPSRKAPPVALDLGGGSGATIANEPYTLKVKLASKNLDSFLNGFFDQWATGNQGAITDLAPGLHTHFPNIRALDRLAGISHLSERKVSFIWQVIDNSGIKIRIFVQVFQYPGTNQETPNIAENQFQMMLVQDNGEWAISGLGSTVQFP